MTEGKRIFLDVRPGVLLVRTTGPYRERLYTWKDWLKSHEISAMAIK